jgi:hypothetical protein
MEWRGSGKRWGCNNIGMNVEPSKLMVEVFSALLLDFGFEF